MATKQSWLDDKANPLIDAYVQKLGTFVDAMADGRIDDRELAGRSSALSPSLKEVEPDAQRSPARPSHQTPLRAHRLQRHANPQLAPNLPPKDEISGLT